MGVSVRWEMGKGISGDARLAAAPYDQWVLLSPAGGSPRPPARYKVRFLPFCCCRFCYTCYCIIRSISSSPLPSLAAISL